MDIKMGDPAQSAADPSQVEFSNSGYGYNQTSAPPPYPAGSPPVQTTQPGYYQPGQSGYVPPGPGYAPAGPHIQNTTVVIQQPQPAIRQMKDWDHGLCGCMENCGDCCYVYWCSCCALNAVERVMDEDTCCNCCCVPHPVLLTALRAKVREREGIRGFIYKDHCASICCYMCVLCQVRKQLRIA